MVSNLNQFLICLRGTCKIICDDGITKKNFTLNRPDQVLYIPNHIWSEQNYINKFLTLTDGILDKKESNRFLKVVQNLRNLKSGQLDKLNIEVRKSKLKKNNKKGIF